MPNQDMRLLRSVFSRKAASASRVFATSPDRQTNPVENETYTYAMESNTIASVQTVTPALPSQREAREQRSSLASAFRKKHTQRHPLRRSRHIQQKNALPAQHASIPIRRTRHAEGHLSLIHI